MPELKPGVCVWPPLNAVVEMAVEAIDRAHVRVAGRCAYVTSARDGVHGPNSFHYSGKALDLRSQDLGADVKRRLLAELHAVLGPKWDILLEAEGSANEHIHLEFDPK